MRTLLRTFTLLAFLLFPALGSRASAQVTHRDEPRLRLGLEGGLGPDASHAGGATFAALGQLGVQIDDRFAIYYQPSLMLNAIGRDPNAALLRSTDHLLIADFTFGAFQIGLGGGVVATLHAPCSPNVTCATGPADLRPAVGARIAAVITVPGVRARWGVPLAANLHLADPLSADRASTLVFTIGVQRF